jgi:hypothetical protein
MATRPDLLGKGWGFPFRFTSLGRVKRLVGVDPAAGVEKVIMSIKQILGTKIGSRVIDRDFGSDLRELLFDPIDELSSARVRFAISSAIQQWERRAELLDIEISLLRVAEGVMEAKIEFQIISTQQVGNLVYSFYLTPEMRVQGQINIR